MFVHVCVLMYILYTNTVYTVLCMYACAVCSIKYPFVHNYVRICMYNVRRSYDLCLYYVCMYVGRLGKW